MTKSGVRRMVLCGNEKEQKAYKPQGITADDYHMVRSFQSLVGQTCEKN